MNDEDDGDYYALQEALEDDPDLIEGRNVPTETEEANSSMIEEMQRDIEATAEPEPDEAAPDDVEPQQELSFAQKRAQLNDFFKNRVESGRWPKTTLPAKGRDQEYDDFLVSLGIGDKKGRAYASQRWTVFKHENGFDRPVISSHVEHNENKIKASIRLYEEESRSSILQAALESFGKVSFTGLEKEARSMLMGGSSTF
jgi:hypothetical protein